MTETKGIFGKKSEELVTQNQIDNSTLANLNRRMRVLEERFLTLEKKQQITAENMIETHKGYDSELRVLNQEVGELKQEFIELRDKLQVLSNQLETKANQSEFLVFKKYLELWRPVNFVTEKAVEKMIEQKLMKLKK